MLIQEYLEGTEYVVDGASRDGVFKCITLLWKYHKEAINGHSGSLRSLTSVYVAVVQEQQYLPAPSPPPSQWGGAVETQTAQLSPASQPLPSAPNGRNLLKAFLNYSKKP